MKVGFKQYLNEVAPKQVDIKFQYHTELNPDIWTKEKKLKPEVKKALLKIADEFEEFLDTPQMKVIDIIITGSLANYNYTPQSDIDLHLIADTTSKDGEACTFDIATFFKTKKVLWNEQHDIKIYDYPVELYVQLADESLAAAGIYSIKDDKWVEEPQMKKDKLKIDRYAVKIKTAELMSQIDDAIENKVDNRNSLNKIAEKIVKMRKAGLSSGGEFSVENLTFKALRNNGYIEKLMDYRLKLGDKELSLD